MELHALRYFVAVAGELHFRRAAEKLHMTQAPLSTAVRKLEDELGVRLFERTSRSVKLTAAGEFFLREAEAVLARERMALRNLREFVSGDLSPLVVGYNEPALNSVLPQVLARCRKNYPALRLELRELETAEQMEQLRRGILDIALMRPYGIDLAGFDVRLVHRETYRLVMPADHPLAEKETVSGADLSGQEVILFAREVNPAVFDRLVEALSSGGVRPPIFRQDARNKHSMLAMVRAGFGVALMPESCCRDPLPGMKTAGLATELPPVDIMAVWSGSGMSDALRDFIPLLPEGNCSATR